jgi:hypothetical protein
VYIYVSQGVQFDPDLPQTIRLEFAKSNTKASKPKQQPMPASTPHPTIMHSLAGRKFPFTSHFVHGRKHIYSLSLHEERCDYNFPVYGNKNRVKCFNSFLLLFSALGGPFFTSAPELWPPLVLPHSAAAAAAAAAAELPGGLQAQTLVHPGLHPQVNCFNVSTYSI